MESSVSPLYIRFLKRIVCRLFNVVGALSIRVDGALGGCNAATEKDAGVAFPHRIYGGGRTARISFRSNICPLSGTVDGLFL